MVTQNDLQVNPEKLVARLTMNLTETINTCQPTLDTDNLGQYQYCWISTTTLKLNCLLNSYLIVYCVLLSSLTRSRPAESSKDVNVGDKIESSWLEGYLNLHFYLPNFPTDDH